MRRPLWILLALSGLALVAGGCGFFRPATPERPSSQNCASDITEDYSVPSATLKTMAAAMTRKARGRCAYLGAIADSASEGVAFHITFPAALVDQRRDLGGIPVWTLAIEGVFYDDFMELSDANYTLTWSDYQEAGSDLGTPTDSTLFRRYSVVPTGSSEILAAGTAELRFHLLGSGAWVLVNWIDGLDTRRLDPDHGVDNQTLLDWTISQRRLEAYDANF